MYVGCSKPEVSEVQPLFPSELSSPTFGWLYRDKVNVHACSFLCNEYMRIIRSDDGSLSDSSSSDLPPSGLLTVSFRQKSQF